MSSTASQPPLATLESLSMNLLMHGNDATVKECTNQSATNLFEDIAKSIQGNELESLKYMERALFLKRESLPPESTEMIQYSQIFVTKCNMVSMKLLKEENYVMAYDLLKKAEIITNNAPTLYIGDEKLRLKLRAATYNNMACFFKRRNKFKSALQHLQHALHIEQNELQHESISTHLNLCAVLSCLQMHEQALQHVRKALTLIQSDTNPNIEAVTYHNMAVEFEFLNNYKEALKQYERALEVAAKKLGPHAPLTTSIRSHYQSAIVKHIKRQKQHLFSYSHTHFDSKLHEVFRKNVPQYREFTLETVPYYNISFNSYTRVKPLPESMTSQSSRSSPPKTSVPSPRKTQPVRRYKSAAAAVDYLKSMGEALETLQQKLSSEDENCK